MAGTPSPALVGRGHRWPLGLRPWLRSHNRRSTVGPPPPARPTGNTSRNLKTV
ncbi:hypothetical protein BX600DRAFT_478335, partial [Xylariales sp. PMI_506]